MEEPAAVVVNFGARLGKRVLAVGNDARDIEARGFDPIDPAKVKDRNDLFTRLVRLEDAPWWPDDGPVDLDPWDHNGECVVVWPFRQDTRSPELGAAVLRYFGARALSSEGVRRLGPAQRAWLAIRPPTVHFAELPPTDAYAALAEHVSSMRLDPENAPALPAPRPLAELSWQQWGIALAPLLFPLIVVLRSLPRAPPLRVLILVLGISLWVSFTSLARSRARGPRDDLSRERLAREAALRAALRRRYEALPTGEDEPGYAGLASFRLGMTGIAEIGVALAAIGLGAAAAVPVVGQGPAAVAALVTFLVVVSAVALLGGYLFGVRVAVGERGIRLHRRGVLERPLFIPLSRIRSVVMRRREAPNALTFLDVLLLDGDALTLRVNPMPDVWRARQVALAAEEAILSRLGPPRRYRVPT